MPDERRVRVNPRISAPKMGEYLAASAARRERILMDQKFPPTFKQARYRDAEAAMRGALLSDTDTARRLEEHAERIARLPATTTFEESARDCSVLALRRFARMVDELPTAGANFSPVSQEALVLRLEGVAVSVFPLVTSRRVVRGRVRTGAILAVMRKTEPVGDIAGKAIAELLRRALTQSGYEDVHPADCIVVDVFQGEHFTAPVRGERILSDIRSACREIAVRWPALGDARAA